MNKADLKTFVKEATGITKKEAGIVIDAVLYGIKAGAVKDGKVTLVNFGSFNLKTPAARKARTPRTGEAIDVPEKTVVKFKPSANFKEMALDGNLNGEADEAEAEEAEADADE